jgi:hypothetical protein
MRGRTRLPLLIASILIGSHLLLTGAAFASPPDPLVLGGIFDDADGDDIVLLVMAMTGTVVEGPVLDGSVSPVGVLAWKIHER